MHTHTHNLFFKAGACTHIHIIFFFKEEVWFGKYLSRRWGLSIALKEMDAVVAEHEIEEEVTVG